MLKLFTICKCPGCGRRYLRWFENYKPFCDQLCMQVHQRRWYHGQDTNRKAELARVKESAEYKRRIRDHESAGQGKEADAVVREFLEILNRPENIGGVS